MTTRGPQAPLARLADVLLRRRNVVLAGVLALTAVAVEPASRLAFDRSIESLYADDDPHLRDYRESKALFGGDEFVIVAYRDPALWVDTGNGRGRTLSDEAAARIRELADRLNQVPGVRTSSTQSLAELLKPQRSSLVVRLFLRFRQEELRRLARNILLGNDEQTTAIVLRLEPEPVPRTAFGRPAALPAGTSVAPVPRGETIARIRAIARSFSTQHELATYIVGEPVQVHDMFDYVEEDGRVLFWMSLAVLAGVLFFYFRSPRWVLLPLVVVVVAIVLTEAFLVVTRMRLSMVSSMLNSLMTIIGIATVTHVTVRFRQHRKSLLRADAFRQTFVELSPAVFWTIATTAAGFGALLISRITPVRSFSIMMSLGSLMILVSAGCLLPGGILLGRFDADPHGAPAEARLVSGLVRIVRPVETHPWSVAAVFALLVAATGVGLWRLDVETDFSANFRSTSPIIRSLNFVEQHLGGAGTWEVNFSAPKELDLDFVERVRRITTRLREQYGSQGSGELTKIVSLSDGVDLVPRIPFSKNTLADKLEMLSEFQPEFVSGLYNAEQGRMRIVLRAYERRRAENKRDLIHRVVDSVREEFPDAKATGLYVLLTFLIESLLRDQWLSFLLATVSIGTMLTIAFRSLPLGVGALVPNLFPIVVVVGVMGWAGIPVNIATAMIASVSMGLTADATIHYVYGYRRHRRMGASLFEALQATHRDVGRALVFANFALIAGFTVLTLSHFIPLIHFGILVSAAILGGLIGDLVLLPLMIRWIEPAGDDLGATR